MEYPEIADEGEEGELLNVLVFKFYIADYGMQSKPFIVPLSNVRDQPMREVAQKAKLDFLMHGLKHPEGGPSRKQLRLLRDGRLTHTVRLARMTRSQIGNVLERSEKKWKRWKRTRGRRR
jgi:RNA polymerase-interacting CarD/CdnL/TRCF family regulator